MSIEAENADHELTVEEILKEILKEIRLLNSRFEDLGGDQMTDGDDRWR